MRYRETPLAGVWLIKPERRADERGFFARTYDRDEFAARGMDPAVVQCNTSFNTRAGTLRGLHFQTEPYGEPKLVRCTRGAIFDVAVDLRASSPTHRAWYGAELTERNGHALYIPAGLAHGFQTLVDETEALYMMGHEYVPAASAGVRWDDTAFSIQWPASDARVISQRDASYPDYEP